MTNEELLEKLRKELLLSRVFNTISSVLMVLVLLGGFLFYQKAQEYEKLLTGYVEEVQEHSEEIQAAVTQLALLDVEVLNETLAETLSVLQEVDWEMLSESIDSVDWEMVSKSIESVDWESVSKQLNELDVEAFNEAVEGLDTKEVSEALENMNDSVDKLKKAADALSKVGDKVSGLGDKIGGYFKNDKD